MWTTHIFTSLTCLLSNTHFPKSADLKVNVSSFLFSQVESYVSCSIHLDTIRNSSSAVSIKYTTVCKLFGHGQRTHFFWNNLRCSQFTELNKLACHPIRITSTQKPLCNAFKNKSLFEKKRKKLLEKSFCCSVGLDVFFSHLVFGVFDMVALSFHQVWTLFKSWPNIDETIQCHHSPLPPPFFVHRFWWIECVCVVCIWFLIKIDRVKKNTLKPACKYRSAWMAWMFARY